MRTNYNAPLFPGLVLGVLAFAATYLLIQDFVAYGAQLNIGLDLSDFQYNAWYVLNAHHVPIAQTASSGGETLPLGSSVNIIAESEQWYQFLYLIPPIPLFVAGLLLADRVGGQYKAGYSFLNGAFVALGYLVTTLIVTWISAVSSAGFGFTARVGPAFGEAFLIAGLIYPIVFGGIGGLAHYVTQQL